MLGTIAFIGNTHFSDGLWLGIIFDQPVGRNNGSYEGIRYFKCGKNHGTFVRPCQVRKISFVPPESEVPKKNCRKHYPNYLRDDCLSKPNEKHNSYTKKNTLLKKIREDITPKSTSMPFILSEIDAKLNHGEESEPLSGTLANFPENIFSRREKEGRSEFRDMISKTARELNEVKEYVLNLDRKLKLLKESTRKESYSFTEN
ncbi:Tubulin-specific chaperone B like protein [Argiope bruennichi]|uniref:Tubulin-specific chaperone B like protein n=1 Tax=Argiope bruennichi TaxID=94029 RepID=A0A8T0EAH3_ARGBR|nr:Tubulin-specific chaperone B like protein [Argiope bruennichi]